MATISIYVKDEDAPMIRRASKLSRFHEDKALGQMLTEQCQKIIEKYEPTDEVTK